MGKGGGFGANDMGRMVGNAITFGMATKNEEKTKQTKIELDARAEREERAAETAKANAETARLAKIKEDEDALVRRNALLGAVRQRLSGRSSSNTRLSSAEM